MGLSGAQFGNCNDYNYINPSGVFLHVNKWEVIMLKFMVIKDNYAELLASALFIYYIPISSWLPR